MSRQSNVYVLVLDGQHRYAFAFAQRRYLSCKTVILSKIKLRESGWKGQLRALRQLRGEALLIFTDSLESLQEAMLLKWTVLVHRCRETVLADPSGSFEVISRVGFLGLLPRSLISILADGIVLACACMCLKLFQLWLKLAGEPEDRAGWLPLAFLVPLTHRLHPPCAPPPPP